MSSEPESGAPAEPPVQFPGLGSPGERTLESLLRETEAESQTSGLQAVPNILDPVGLIRHLVASGRFHWDTGLGRVFHPGKLSFRENAPVNSLHFVVDANRIYAHVDLVSPLGLRPGASSRYAVGRVAAHNLSGIAADFVRLLRGRQGDHRCELDCEWFRADPPRADAPHHPDAGPWSVQLEVRVAGSIDERRLADALAKALGGRPGSLRVVDCPDDAAVQDARVEHQSLAIPIAESPPLRVLLARSPSGAVLMLNVNHAATDGFGALRLMHALARAYSEEVGTLPDLDFMVQADLPVRPTPPHHPPWKRLPLLAVERLRNLLAPPARLVPDEPAEEAGYGFHLVTIPLGSGQDPKRRAVDDDVLLAALHRAIGEWNAAHGFPGRRISVLVPADLRPPIWPDELVGNFSVTARVGTSRRHRSSLAAALAEVRAQTSRNNRSRTGTALIAALDRSGLLPLWTKQSPVVLEPLTRNRLVDTALFCDLGQIAPPSFGPDAGPVTEVWFSAPSRAPMALAIGAATMADRLYLSFRYPYRLFSADAARRFAELYLAEIEPVIPGPPTTKS